MTNKTLEGMARADWGLSEHLGTFDDQADHVQKLKVSGHKRALLWLADNVSDEMVTAYILHKPRIGTGTQEAIRQSISTALRAAAEEATP